MKSLIKENFAHRFFFIWDKTTSKNQHHAVSMTTKNWEFGKCSEPWKLSVFESTIDMKLKKLEGLFSSGEYGELSIKKFVTIYYYYE